MPLSIPPFQIGKISCYLSAVAVHCNSSLNLNLPVNAPFSLPALSQFIVLVAGQIQSVTSIVFDKASIQTGNLGETAIQASDLLKGYYRCLAAIDDSLSFDDFVSAIDADARKIASAKGISFLN